MREKIRKVLFVISTIVTIGALAGIGWYFLTRHKEQETVEEVKDKVIETIDKCDEQGNPYLRYYLINNNVVQEQYKDVFIENMDFVGWITIDDTNVDYPVVYTPEDEQYYLRRNFYKEYSSGGVPFISVGTTLNISDNTIIFGHSMNDGSMFQNIKNYEDEEFYKSHKYITFNTLTKSSTYEVVAAFRTITHDDTYEGFDAYRYINMDEEHFNEYITECQKETPYEVPKANYGDKLISLSTCAYHATNGRYIVVAKEISSIEVDTTKDPIEIININ